MIHEHSTHDLLQQTSANLNLRVLLGAGLLLQIWLAVVVAIAVDHFRTLFYHLQGWSHRLAGGLLLVWLVVGCCCCLVMIGYEEHSERSDNACLAYDVILGCLGVAATLTAARDFPHRYVMNSKGQSGTLSEKAMVTHSEMVEHSFYQGLNLAQTFYLHAAARLDFLSSSSLARMTALLLVTAPWLVRSRFPVHSFSENWKQQTSSSKRTNKEMHMYRIKKAQYLFYKHVILHGINLTVCLSDWSAPEVSRLAMRPEWRIFWVCLNAAYVMEFFLQSLVKRSVINQSTMLLLNRSLMAVSSVAALQSVLLVVRWDVCAVSLGLNLCHRKRDVFNTLAIASFAMIVRKLASGVSG